MTALLRLTPGLALLAFTFLAPQSPTNAGWALDRAHSRVTFTVTKWGFVEVEGRFHDFTGTVFYDQRAPERSHIAWSVKVATVDTGEPARDRSLQAPEYLDAAHHPELRFASTSVRRVADNELDVAGTITIRGVAKPLTIRVHYGGRHDVPDEGTFDIFQTSFSINRYDFGVVGGSVLGPAISRDVKVTLIAAARHQP